MMTFPAALTPLSFAWKGLRSRKLQSTLLLIAFTISYGVACVLLAVLTSFRARVAEDLSRIGWRVINVHPGLDLRSFFFSVLTPELVRELASAVEGEAASATLETVLLSRAPRAPGSAQGNNRHAALLIGTSPGWARIADLRLLEGRFFEEGEADACVLDAFIARQLFDEGRALGKSIEAILDGKPRSFRVVGVAEDPFRIRGRFSSLEGPGTPRSLLVRMMEYKNIYVPREALGAGKPILLALIRVPPEHRPAEDVVKIRRILKERGSTAMAWDRRSWAEKLIGAAAEVSRIANFLWATILFITALMSAVVLAVALRGRYREIAIRRVEGARRLQILAQLLWESGLVSAAAGGIGFFLARLAGALLEEEVLGWPVLFLPGDFLLVLAVGSGLALLTTLFPAWRASTLHPVEVLKKA